MNLDSAVVTVALTAVGAIVAFTSMRSEVSRLATIADKLTVAIATLHDSFASIERRLAILEDRQFRRIRTDPGAEGEGQ